MIFKILWGGTRTLLEDIPGHLPPLYNTAHMSLSLCACVCQVMNVYLNWTGALGSNVTVVV